LERFAGAPGIRKRCAGDGSFMIVAMWIFPEAGGKKKAPKD